MAARTFFHNLVADASDMTEWQRYVASTVEEQVERGVLVRELNVLLADGHAMSGLIRAQIDLVVGGPPGQGFSLAASATSREGPDTAMLINEDFLSRGTSQLCRLELLLVLAPGETVDQGDESQPRVTMSGRHPTTRCRPLHRPQVTGRQVTSRARTFESMPTSGTGSGRSDSLRQHNQTAIEVRLVRRPVAGLYTQHAKTTASE